MSHSLKSKSKYLNISAQAFRDPGCRGPWVIPSSAIDVRGTGQNIVVQSHSPTTSCNLVTNNKMFCVLPHQHPNPNFKNIRVGRRSGFPPRPLYVPPSLLRAQNRVALNTLNLKLNGNHVTNTKNRECKHFFKKGIMTSVLRLWWHVATAAAAC